MIPRGIGVPSGTCRVARSAIQCAARPRSRRIGDSAWEIRGNRSCTSLDFQALSCNGRLPEVLNNQKLSLTLRHS